jgi:peptide/nickel transport system substrate-binding protein
MQRRSFLAVAAGSLASLSRPALAQGQRNTLRFVPQSDLTVIDPVFTTAYVTRNHALMVWDQLYGLDSDLRPQPQMVEGHTVEDDGKLWTFTLRPGLKFHDGEPVRGRDCVASIRRWAERNAEGGTLMARVAEITAPADNRFVIRLQKPYPGILSTLARLGPPALMIMPERIAQTSSSQQIKELIGSGPFRWKADERIVGAKVVYEKNRDYLPRPGGTSSWAAGPKVVHVDRVEWTVMPDPGTAMSALQNGEVDWWENPPNDLLPLLERSRSLKARRSSPLGIVGTGIFNHLHAPFNNPEIRRVVMEAFSQEDCMAAAAGEPSMWRAGVGMFPPETPMANDAGMATITGPRNLEASKKALQVAGYKGERVVLMAASDNPVLAALGEVANDVLRRLGMNVDYVVSDWGTLVQRRASKAAPDAGGWNMFHTTWYGLDLINPSVSQMLRTAGGQTYFGWPDIPELEALRNSWIDASDLAEQKRLARDIQVLALKQGVYIPTGQYFNMTAYSAKLADVPDGLHAFWSARFT